VAKLINQLLDQWDSIKLSTGKLTVTVATYVSLPRGMPRRQPTGMFLGPLVLA
jgi:hypothetical protein